MMVQIEFFSGSPKHKVVWLKEMMSKETNSFMLSLTETQMSPIIFDAEVYMEAYKTQLTLFFVEYSIELRFNLDSVTPVS